MKLKHGLFGNTLIATGTLIAALNAQADTLKIGIAGPVTGPVAQYGDMQKIGAMMAIDRINAAGGINGMTLEGVIYDDACDPKQAVAVANRIVNDDIRHVIGHLCSSSTEPASDIYEEEGVMMITAASTSPGITEKGYQLIFRTIGLDNLQGTLAAEYIQRNIKPQRLAVIHDKQQYGEGLATTVRDLLAESGTDTVMFEGVTPGDKDFSALIAKLKRNNVDFVYYGGYHPELGLILRQSREKGLDTRFMGPEGVVNSDLIAIAGKAMEGVLATAPKSFDQSPENMALVEAFKERDEDPSGPFVFPAYTAIQVMTEAMGATGKTDPYDLADYLRANRFNTTIGEIGFDKKGDLTEPTFEIYTLHTDGSKTPVSQ
ncbi:high-affinity branched-chain amino acid ABC transporter substrate-binding protein [Marinobacterium marinum]|uniref:High-affinity branched-chain amino acid ABC transporter substrate-binding protein n=1 Tax=Marinobacterium marinum TaxID=2756129 RepID=A0A7W1WZN2_9GAMM|nr:high-affinity branched-chain amino acid ABC transporter substrate-binding protein [Marinobacterium marinum]MBA4503185.1 high-affinity branched-chain amino acid ABC transporter substrate-binding protein [Marinobacterium marinum]